MQMKIIVDTPEDYKIWLKEQTNLLSRLRPLMLLQMRMVAVGDSLKAKDTASVANAMK
jgi:cytochrome c oxidase subunit 2